jgi:hypothetical protein
MLSIDADAHVIETKKTWDYLEGSDRRYRPVPITVDMPSGKRQNFWIIGGRLIGGRENIGQDTSKESREMANIDSRLKHMDEIGMGVQVLYPTLFLRPVTKTIAWPQLDGSVPAATSPRKPSKQGVNLVRILARVHYFEHQHYIL